MREIYACILIPIVFLSACQPNQTLKEKQAELTTGNVDQSFKYTCNEVGWQTYLPKDWHFITQDETKKMNEKGRELIEKSSGSAVDMSGLRELVNLKKDPFNSFLSTIEKYDAKTMGSYEDHNADVEEVVKQAYRSKDIKFELKDGSEKIDNVLFHVVEIKIFTPGGDKILLNQKMYSALLKGYDFGMTMNYNNEDDKQILLKIVEGSRFL